MPARVGSFVFLEMSCLGVCVCVLALPTKARILGLDSL